MLTAGIDDGWEDLKRQTKADRIKLVAMLDQVGFAGFHGVRDADFIAGEATSEPAT